MARVARSQGDRETARELSRVARWARTFNGWQSAPMIGPAAPSIAGLYATVTGAALSRAHDRGEADRLAMAAAFHGGR